MLMVRLCFFLLLMLRVSWAGLAGSPLTAVDVFKVQTSIQGSVLHVDIHIDDCCYLYLQRFYADPQKSVQLQPIRFLTQAIHKDDPDFGPVDIFHHALIADIPFQGQGSVMLHWQGCNERMGICYPPQNRFVLLKAEPVAKSLPPEFLHQLGIYYLGGLAMSLTPCIWPMLPILAGIIARQPGSTRRSRIRLSLSYVLGTAFSYGLLGALFAWFGHGINLAAWFQKPVWLITMASIFVILALSLFDLYTLRLPSGLSNRIDQLSRRQRLGSLSGTFVMGALAALIVSPCVSAPLAAALVMVSQLGIILAGFSALFVLGLGIGTPLLIFGAFQAHFMPKAGSWMKGVQAIFGIALLATAVNLLARLMPDWLSVFLYSVLLVGSGVSLGAFDSAAWGWPRTLKALGLILALLGALGVMKAWQQFWSMSDRTPGTAVSLNQPALFIPEQTVTTPEQLQSVLTQDKGRPILLDFWASWCVSCKELEHQVLDQPAMLERLNHLHRIRVDVSSSSDASTQLLNQYQLVGPPALVLLDAGLQRRTPARSGIVTTDQLNQDLDQVLP